MSTPSVLICGAGVAGPVCAYWLARSGIKTTIIERSPALRIAGQQIDIRGPGFTVVQRMGLEEIVRARTSLEKGLAFVNSDGKRFAAFPAEAGGSSFTSDIEILRENLVKIFYDATKEKTEYIFGDRAMAISQGDGQRVRVTLEKGGEREFDVVIGADGMSSATRRLAYPSHSQNHLKSLGQYTAFFTIPYRDSDGDFATWFNAPKRRSVLLRPDHEGATRAYLSVIDPRAAASEGMSIAGQKKLMSELFADVGGELPRVLEAMDDADDFYMQEIAQVKVEDYSLGRVALVGDAGYCPSPISGMGTSLAIVGAYILAGELASCGGNFEQGLRLYEQKMKPFVTKAQDLPPGFPHLINPETQWGINIFNLIVRFLAWSRLPTLLGKFTNSSATDKNLPFYDL